MSDTARRDTATTTAAQLGGELRTRRQSLGWELAELAQSLRIRQPYLEAIEAGRIGDLPGPTYALGFVRAYASALGLPGEQMASRFRAQSAEANIRPALSFPAPVPQRGVPAGALMLLGLVILAGAYAGWYSISEHQRTPAQTVPPIPDRLLPAAAKPAPSPQVASILPTAAPPALQPPAMPAQLAQPGPARAAAVPAASAPGAPARPGQPPPALAATAPASAGSVPSPAIGAAAPPASGSIAPPAAVSVAPPAATAPGTRIVVKANADAWITIKQPGGAPALNKLMHAGETWPVPAGLDGLLLTTGNAGGTELDVDGTAIATLGPSGAVRRDLKLDAAALKAGPLPPIVRGHAAPRPAPPPAAG